jgi:hypothetical protein
MICEIKKRRIGYEAVVIHEGRPRVTTRVETLTRKGAMRVLAREGCGGLGRARRRRR